MEREKCKCVGWPVGHSTFSEHIPQPNLTSETSIAVPSVSLLLSHLTVEVFPYQEVVLMFKVKCF